MLTLTGTASKADYETALRSIQFDTSNTNPSASKTVEFKVNDGDADSNAAHEEHRDHGGEQPAGRHLGRDARLHRERRRDRGRLRPDGHRAGGQNINGASASISSGFESGEDALAWTDNNGADTITLDGSSTAQTIVLTGTDTAANYQAALRAVTYLNSSEDPSTASRTVTFAATDGSALTGDDTRTIAVTAVDDPPVAVDDSRDGRRGRRRRRASTCSPNDTDVDGGPEDDLRRPPTRRTARSCSPAARRASTPA